MQKTENRNMNTNHIPSIDETSPGFDDSDLEQMKKDVERGYRRFFHKRGIDPMDGSAFAKGKRRSKKYADSEE